MATTTLRAATTADIPFLMQCERSPHAHGYVSHWSEAQHQHSIDDPTYEPYVIELGGRPVGYALLGELLDADGNAELARLVVLAEAAGHGVGRATLALVADRAFAHPKVHRFWLDVVPENERARHLYRASGFTEEGILRESWISPAGRTSLVIMSLLRPEWEARTSGAETPAGA